MPAVDGCCCNSEAPAHDGFAARRQRRTRGTASRHTEPAMWVDSRRFHPRLLPLMVRGQLGFGRQPSSGQRPAIAPHAEAIWPLEVAFRVGMLDVWCGPAAMTQTDF